MKQKFDSRYISVLARIRAKIALSRLSLWAEVLTRRFWPLATLALAVYAFVAFEGFTLIPTTWVKPVIFIIGILMVALLVLGFWKFRAPNTQAALDRLDDSLDGHPLASLRDTSAVGHFDPLTKALWDRHQSRMVEKTLSAKTTPPDLRLASRDRYGLRLMALVAGFAAVAFAPSNVVDSVQNAFVKPSAAAVAGLSFEAWANPPAYTGKPSIYMLEVPEGEPLHLPQGSELIIRVYGIGDGVRVDENLSDRAELTTASQQAGLFASEFTAETSGDVTLWNGLTKLASWQIIIDQDQPPVVEVSGALENDGNGALQLPFDASDDYGVKAGTATISLDLAAVDRRFGLAADPVELPAVVIDLPLPFSGDRTEISEVLSDDLSEHMWNGLPVRIDLSVTDEFGQAGTTEFYGERLPGLQFYVPLAAAIAEMRRDIMWSPDNQQRVLKVLKAITFLPEDYRLSASTYLNLRTIVRRYEAMLEDGLSAEEQEEITAYMWEIALQIEMGDVNSARERLERAQERLSQAIEDGADQAEIDQLMEEMRDATDDYLQALADEAMQNGDQQQQAQNGETQTLSQQDLQEMMDRIQELTENGQNAEAQQLLEELMDLLQNLQMAENQGQGEGSQGQQQLQEMQDALNEQQGLSDETFDELQDQMNGDQPDSQENGEGPSQQELADRQEALRELLDEMQQNGAGQESLEEAERNMGDARDALEEGDLGRALDEQADAMENLREGMRDVIEEMQRAEADGTGQQQSGENDSDETDPLGRPLGEDGRSTTSENLLPEQSATDRARELLDEIRRRSGEGNRPTIELDYLRRLLENF